jgi:uncharacterized protein YggU (UPF0235/DUF167 family)
MIAGERGTGSARTGDVAHALRGQLTIEAGKKNRHKLVRVEGMTLIEVTSCLSQ